MKRHDPTHMRPLLLACCLAAAYPAHAEATVPTDTTSSATATPTTTAIGTSATTEARLSAEFAGFLGGKEQALSVVSGLRQGTAFSLDAESGATGTGSTSATPPSTRIEPAGGTMGYGNIRITLKLAEAQLNQMGITQPTNEELAAVLLGGEVNGTPVDGILALRADGMGWGQIAKEYGLTVGQVMGKGAGPTKQATATTGQAKSAGKAGAGSTNSAARSNGYISSTPKSASASQARSNGYIPSGGGKAGGAGTVTAAGGSVGNAAQGGGKGQAPKTSSSGHGAGAVSAGGQPVSAAGASHAGGGNAMAPGQAKKN